MFLVLDKGGRKKPRSIPYYYSVNYLPHHVVTQSVHVDVGRKGQWKQVTTRNTCLQQPLAVISKHCFNTMFQHEVFLNYFNTERRLTLLASCEPWQHEYKIVLFWTKGHKIVEILALLTTKLSSSKMYKVGMLFFIQWTLI